MKRDHVIPVVALLMLSGCSHPDKADLALLEQMNAAQGTAAYQRFQHHEIACNVPDPICARLWAHRAAACLIAARNAPTRSDPEDFRCADDFETAASLQESAVDALTIYEGLGESLEFLRGLSPNADAPRLNARLAVVVESMRRVNAAEHAAYYGAGIVLNEFQTVPPSPTQCTALRGALQKLQMFDTNSTLASRRTNRMQTLKAALAEDRRGCHHG